MKPLSQCRLYTFLDTAYLRGRSAEMVTQQLCDGGSDLIQLRAKGASPDEVCRLAEVMLRVTERAGIGLVINDHVAVAQAVGARLCHLGQEDFFGAGHRHVAELIPAASRLQLGLSSHSPEQAQQAVRAGAAYLGIGPVFATPTKASAAPTTLAYVRWAAAELKIPWFAIGGINLATLNSVKEAGARSVGVVSAILNAPDVRQACQAIRRRLESDA